MKMMKLGLAMITGMAMALSACGGGAEFVAEMQISIQGDGYTYEVSDQTEIERSFLEVSDSGRDVTFTVIKRPKEASGGVAEMELKLQIKKDGSIFPSELSKGPLGEISICRTFSERGIGCDKSEFFIISDTQGISISCPMNIDEFNVHEVKIDFTGVTLTGSSPGLPGTASLSGSVLDRVGSAVWHDGTNCP